MDPSHNSHHFPLQFMTRTLLRVIRECVLECYVLRYHKVLGGSGEEGESGKKEGGEKRRGKREIERDV